jgi:predicted metal-dependent RNase|tara:strand:+ start:544 stop:798 length:255 start_codon:yes stop_codon:yes gene_type:complete
MTPSQKADRLALIKEIAERKKKMSKIRKRTASVISRAKTASRKAKEIKIPKESNIYQWTDASKYAQEYYGETLHYTTKFDNDWD